MDAISLSDNDAVQKDLALSDEQKTKVKELVQTYSEKRRESMQDLGGERGERPSPEEMRARMEKIREVTAKLEGEFKPQLTEIIGADHVKRLDEIAVQAQGARALNDDDTEKALAITDEQKTKLAEVNRDYAEKTRELFTGGPPSDETREKMQTLNKEHLDAAIAVLTPEQKTKFAEMRGKDFDTSTLRRGFGRGGRGGAGGARRPSADN
jgi:Spy/CpxP family protein refolding chaperone